MNANTKPLRIVHCFRSPVGGIFRHVRDLISEQHKQGHKIGILCDNNTGGEYEERLFESISPQLELGLHRISMRRSINPSDLISIWNSYKQIKALSPDVLHSHGAKGGAYARVIGKLLDRGNHQVARLYCPHGGSIHFDANTIQGKMYFRLERLMERWTDRLIFVSEYEQRSYREKIGNPRCPSDLVYNGLSPSEFEPVEMEENAADFLYIGMMRDLKGCDVFLNSLPLIEALIGRPITAHMVGDGPQLAEYKSMAAGLDLKGELTFHAPMPARHAFAKARIVVVPSRAESMPYIVLETIAAQRPLVATRVGGIPEIFGPNHTQLVEPDNEAALATAMATALQDPNAGKNAAKLASTIKDRFSIKFMAETIGNSYLSALAEK